MKRKRTADWDNNEITRGISTRRALKRKLLLGETKAPAKDSDGFMSGISTRRAQKQELPPLEVKVSDSTDI